MITAKVIEAFLPIEPRSVKTARLLAEKLADRVQEATQNDLKLLISELVTNTVRHSGRSAEERLAVKIIARNDLIRAEITDPGGGFVAASRAPDAEEADGWGLQVVDRLSSRWGVIKDPPTKVWFEIDLMS